jgi:hypothetical protein
MKNTKRRHQEPLRFLGNRELGRIKRKRRKIKKNK